GDLPPLLQGHGVEEYNDEPDLLERVTGLLRNRIDELTAPPEADQHVIHQKMQIDAVWQHRIEGAEGAVYFLAGDVSWGPDMEEALRRKAREGVLIRVCCRRPSTGEAIKRNNIQRLADAGAEIRFFDSSSDPGLRGFIWEPYRLPHSEVIFVDKEQRRGSPG